jgi:hypothetical protein
MLGDNLVGDPQSEAGSRYSLGREEGLKHAAECGFVHSGSTIRHGDRDAVSSGFPIASGSGAEHDATAFWKGIHRITDEVCEDLAYLTRLRDYGRCCTKLADNLNPKAAQARFQEYEDGFNQFVDVDLLGLGSSPVKAEGLHGDLRDAVQFILGQFDIAARLFAAR